MKGLWPELPSFNIIYCIYKFQFYDQYLEIPDLGTVIWL